MEIILIIVGMVALYLAYLGYMAHNAGFSKPQFPPEPKLIFDEHDYIKERLLWDLSSAQLPIKKITVYRGNFVDVVIEYTNSQQHRFAYGFKLGNDHSDDWIVEYVKQQFKQHMMNFQ